MSYKPEVLATDATEWHSNNFRFATIAEVEEYLSGLSLRWETIAKTRVVKTDDAVNYRYRRGRLIAVSPLTYGPPSPICKT